MKLRARRTWMAGSGCRLGLVLLSVLLATTRATAEQAEAGTQAQRSLEGGFRIQQEGPSRAKLVAPGAKYVRAHFSRTPLPAGTNLLVKDASGRDWQRFDSPLLAAWSYSTPYFNGDTVLLELAGGPEGPPAEIATLLQGVRLETNGETSLAGVAGAHQVAGVVIGADDRVHSTDAATGRILPMNCTGWLVAAGVGLAAGHCFVPLPSNPQVLEFNVPPSLPDGTIQHPPPGDQFPIDNSSVKARYDDWNQAPGSDWAVFRLEDSPSGPVFSAGRPFFRLATAISPTAPGPGMPLLMVTGYGGVVLPPGSRGRYNAKSQTEQESLGRLLNTVRADADHETLVHDADTEPGSSGSPVHLPGTRIAVGIHGSGGANNICRPDPVCNVATGFVNAGLLAAISLVAGPPGATAALVDARAPSWAWPADGTGIRPYRSIEDALAAATSAQVLNIVSGHYAGQGLTVGPRGRSVTLRAVAGEVVLGPVPRPLGPAP